MADEKTGEAIEPIISTPEDIIHEAVKASPELPHDKAVLQWFSENYPKYAKIFQKINAKYAERINIGDVALYYAAQELIEKNLKFGGKGPPYLNLREAILLLFVMVFSISGAMILLVTNGFYGLIAFVAVSAVIIVFFLALEKGLIRKTIIKCRLFFNQYFLYCSKKSINAFIIPKSPSTRKKRW